MRNLTYSSHAVFLHSIGHFSTFPLSVSCSIFVITVYDSSEDGYDEVFSTHKLASMTKPKQEECIRSVVRAAIEEVLGDDLECISCDTPLTAYMTAIDFVQFHFEMSQALPIINESGIHLICEKEPTIDLIVRRVMEAVDQDQRKEGRASSSLSPITNILSFFFPSARKRSNSDAEEESKCEGRETCYIQQ